MAQAQALARRGIAAADLSNRVQDYFTELEEERGNLRREVELLQTQHHDLDRALGIAESRAERAERDRDQARAQRDDLLQKLVAVTTLFGSIKQTVNQGEALIEQTASSLKQAIAAPSAVAPSVVDEIESSIAKIVADQSPAPAHA